MSAIKNKNRGMLLYKGQQKNCVKLSIVFKT